MGAAALAASLCSSVQLRLPKHVIACGVNRTAKLHRSAQRRMNTAVLWMLVRRAKLTSWAFVYSCLRPGCNSWPSALRLQSAPKWAPTRWPARPAEDAKTSRGRAPVFPPVLSSIGHYAPCTKAALAISCAGDLAHSTWRASTGDGVGRMTIPGCIQWP